MDLKNLQLRGEAVRIADSIATDVNHSFGDFSVSRNGTLALNSGLPQSELVWLDRGGNRLGAAIPVDMYSHPALAPNGRQAVFERMDSKTGRSALWKLDVARGEVSLFAAEAACQSFLPTAARWRLHANWKASRACAGNLPVAHVGKRCCCRPEMPRRAVDFTRTAASCHTSRWVRESDSPEVWILPLAGEPAAVPFLSQRGQQQHQGTFSPDGKWIAYYIRWRPEILKCMSSRSPLRARNGRCRRAAEASHAGVATARNSSTHLGRQDDGGR